MKMSKCERCGKTWEYSPLQNVSFPVVYLWIGVEADLCSECRKDLLKWLNGNEKTGENGAPMTDKAVDMAMERLEAPYEIRD